MRVSPHGGSRRAPAADLAPLAGPARRRDRRVGEVALLDVLPPPSPKRSPRSRISFRRSRRAVSPRLTVDGPAADATRPRAPLRCRVRRNRNVGRRRRRLGDRRATALAGRRRAPVARERCRNRGRPDRDHPRGRECFRRTSTRSSALRMLSSAASNAASSSCTCPRRSVAASRGNPRQSHVLVARSGVVDQDAFGRWAVARRSGRDRRTAPRHLRSRSLRSGATAPFAVGAYIGAAYWFTSSTSFANPAVAIARTFSNSFAGIAPKSMPAFVGFEVVGAAVGIALVWYLYPDVGSTADEVVVPAFGSADSENGACAGEGMFTRDSGPPMATSPRCSTTSRATLREPKERS